MLFCSFEAKKNELLEMKNVIEQIYITTDRLNNRISEAEKRISDLDNITCLNAQTIRNIKKEPMKLLQGCSRDRP